MARRLSNRSVTKMGICRTLKRVFEMNRDGLVRNNARRALYDAVRFSISGGVRVSAAGVFGKITVREESVRNDRVCD